MTEFRDAAGIGLPAPSMAKLLRRAYARGITPEYVVRLLRAFVERVSDTRPSDPAAASSTRTAPARLAASSLPVELLTDREREILRLLATGSPNRAIARRLLITEGTVKVHVHRIIDKLGVKRTE